MGIRAIVTGASGMVGEGVLHECLRDPGVEAVLVLGRKSCGWTDAKLTELLVPDFFDLAAVADRLKGWNACFFCLGVSSVGMDEGKYSRLTHDLTLNFARTAARLNSDMTFCYVTGEGTDSTEKGRSMWARVKGRTENDLRKLPFKAAYAFRPGYMQPTPGLKHTQKYYAYIGWAYPALRALFPKHVSTLRELALAMLAAAKGRLDKPVAEVSDIVRLAAADVPTGNR